MLKKIKLKLTMEHCWKDVDNGGHNFVVGGEPITRVRPHTECSNCNEVLKGNQCKDAPDEPHGKCING